MWRRYIQVFAIILLAGFSVYSSFQYWAAIRRNLDPAFVINDPQSKWEKRILAINLPSNIGNEIGYVADWDINPNSDPIGQDEEYVLTQYTLAPLIVKRGSGYEWIVGNLTLPQTNDWLNQNFKGADIHYYGWGIYLIHRVKP